MPVQKFAVLAEVQGYEKPLYLVDLTFTRLMDDVVVPYQSGKTFFIDGVPATAKTLRRMKIILQTPEFDHDIQDLHFTLKLSQNAGMRTPVSDYPVRLSSLFLDRVEDVTSQVLKAYELTMADRIKEYLPNKGELINAASAVFNAGLKFVGSAGSGTASS